MVSVFSPPGSGIIGHRGGASPRLGPLGFVGVGLVGIRLIGVGCRFSGRRGPIGGRLLPGFNPTRGLVRFRRLWFGAGREDHGGGEKQWQTQYQWQK